jgi:hypothetical protein
MPEGEPLTLWTGTDDSVDELVTRVDTVPFRPRIRVSLQHGEHNETTTDAWTLAYYYQQPSSRLGLTDNLDVATPRQRNHPRLPRP